MAILLVSHGSADPGAAATVERIRNALTQRLDAGTAVRASFLEHSGPRPAAALGRLADEGCCSVRLVPLLFAAGFHVRHDLPAEVAEATAAHPDLLTSTAPPLADNDPEAVRLLLDALDERLPSPRRPVDGLILVAAGSSDTAARGTVDSLARQWGARHGVAAVAAFASGPGATVASAAARLRAGQRSAIGVGGLFVAPGALPARAAEAARVQGLPTPAVLGACDAFVELLAHRAQP